jgi:MFS family permease
LSEDSNKPIIPRNVLVLTLSRVIWSMSDTNIDNYLTPYIVALGGGARIIGLINALGSLAAMFLYPVGGYIADKSGRVRLVVVATLLYTSSFLIYGFATHWTWIAAGMIYQNLVLFYVPALFAIMADSVPVGTRGKLYAFSFAIPNLVKILFPFLGGIVIAYLDVIPAMKIGYAISFVMGLVVFVMRSRFLKETMVEAEGISHNPFVVLKNSYADIAESLDFVWDNLRGYSGVSMLLAFLGSMILPFWIFYATEVAGIGNFYWGVILLWSGVAKAVLSFFIGEIVDRYGSRKVFLAGFTLAIPGMFAFTLAKTYYSILILYTIVTLSSVLVWIGSQVYLADSIPRKKRGRVMAMVGSGMSVGVTGVGYASGFLIFLPNALGSIVGGLIYSLNPVYPWLLQGIVLTFGLIMTYMLIQDPERVYE